MDKPQRFNIMAGRVFAELYENLSEPLTLRVVALDPGYAAPAPGADPWEEVTSLDYGISVLAWLRDEGYIRGEEPDAGVMFRAVLTEKALAALNLVPAGLKASFGSQLIEKTKEGALEAVGGLTQTVIATGAGLLGAYIKKTLGAE